MALKILCGYASIWITRITVRELYWKLYLSESIVGIICIQHITDENTFFQKQFEDAKLSAAVSEVVSQTSAPTTHSAGPPPDTVVSNISYKYLASQQQQKEERK